ncbi:hypothetical protein ACEPAI_7842 [Sanghuangporus weigelae]
MSSTSSSTTTESEFDEALRHVTSSRSPLAELVSDPVLLRSITKSRRGKNQSSNQRRTDGKRRDHDSDTASRILSVVLAEEEREVHSLRSQLVVLAEQLKGSMRNAADAEQRAQTAQTRERETRARLLQVEHAKHQADLEVTRQAEEIKRYRLQVETLERQMANMQFDMRTLEKERYEAEEKASDAKDALRQYKQFVRDAQARDEGLEEGRQLGLKRGYGTGRADGFHEGRQEGFDDGFERGRQEGYLAGKIAVRRAERARSRQAIDPYIATHKHQYDDVEDESLKRVQSWAESLSRQESDVIPVEPSSSHSSSSPIDDYDDLYVRG